MRREGERMGLSAGLQGEHTAGADVPLQHQHPSRKTAILPSGLPFHSSHRDSGGSASAATSCLRDLGSDVTVLTRLCPTWACLHRGFHHMEGADLLLLSARRAAVSPHNAWCHSGAGAQLRCGNLWRAQQEQPLGALTQPDTEASAGLVLLLLDLFWPQATSP